MRKTLAIVSGVVAAVSVLAGAATADPRHDDRRDDRRGGESGYRGGQPQGFGVRERERGAETYTAPPPTRGLPGDPRYQPQLPAYPEGYAPPPRRANSLGADWREQQEEARSGVRQGQMAPLGSVIAGIGHRSSGRPLDAGIEYQGSRAVYRVRWLTNDGRRVDYLVDAATGRILSEH